MIEFEVDNVLPAIATIKVIGIGGAGGNTVNSMINAKFKHIEFIVANTDAQALNLSQAEHKIQLGIKSTKGLGAGANPEIGKRAAEEDIEKVLEAVGDADIVFLAAGMGGGTGSGATHVIAKALRDKGILTVAVVTKPFMFEGKRRLKIAEESIQSLKGYVDTLIVIPNQKLLEVVNKNVSMLDAFAMINEVLGNSVKGISDIISKPGHINVDFADLRVIMKDKGIAIMGTGKASGEKRAVQAALNSINSPILENMSIQGAKSVLINITGSKNVGIYEINEAASIIYEQADEDANIILGTVIDDTLEDELSVTIIATGFETRQPEVAYKSPKIAQEAHVQEEQAPVQQPHIAVAPVAQPVAEPMHAQPVQEKELHVAPIQPKAIDQNDLDIPTFLRKAHDAHVEQP